MHLFLVCLKKYGNCTVGKKYDIVDIFDDGAYGAYIKGKFTVISQNDVFKYFDVVEYTDFDYA